MSTEEVMPTKHCSLSLFVFEILLLASLVSSGCSTPIKRNVNQQPLAETNHIYKVQVFTGELVEKRFKALGISIALPKDVDDLEVFSQNWYQKDVGCKNLMFSLGKATPPPFKGLEEVVLSSGCINVFTPKQFKLWRSAGYQTYGWKNIDGVDVFDSIQSQNLTELCMGYRQAIYRIDRKTADGFIMQAFIRRCEYTQDAKTRLRDLRVVTNILESASFSRH